MGSAVSAASNAVSGITSQIPGMGQTQNLTSNPLGYLTGQAGGAVQGIVNAVVPEVPVANQQTVLGTANDLSNLGGTYSGWADTQRGQANNQLGNVQGAIGQSQNAIGQAQDTNQGGNVSNALSLLEGQANGTAPSAAQAQLQQGKDQAIATQQAMANSGNLSQMIGGQKEAMANAANLTQQAANQATQLRAQQQIAGQQNYASAAAQQAGQSSQNAALQQQQAQQQANIYGTQMGQAANYTNAALQGKTAAANTQQAALQTQQQALGQTAQYRAQALGGLMNAGGSALAMASDEDLKTGIESQSSTPPSISSKPQDTSTSTTSSSGYSPEQKAKAKGISQSFSQSGDISSDKHSKKDIKKVTMLEKFLEKIEPVSFEYKEPTGENGKTPGVHLGVIAQDVEKAPGGESMVHDTPEGKMIDVPSAVGMLMAAAADSHDRMNQLEELFKHKKKGK